VRIVGGGGPCDCRAIARRGTRNSAPGAQQGRASSPATFVIRDGTPPGIRARRLPDIFLDSRVLRRGSKEPSFAVRAALRQDRRRPGSSPRARVPIWREIIAVAKAHDIPIEENEVAGLAGRSRTSKIGGRNSQENFNQRRWRRKDC